jgi:hypothetical protein
MLNVPPGQSVRLIFRGRLLEDEKTIRESSLEENSFVHCSISEVPNHERIDVAGDRVCRDF